MEIIKHLEGILGGWRETIPPQFWQTFQDKPFSTCTLCFQQINLPYQRYIVQKYYLEGGLSQESAMCFECRQKLREQYSQESQKAARKIYDKGMMNKRVRRVAGLSSTEDRANLLTHDCLLCSTPKSEVKEYLEYAYCEGDEIVYYVHPFMICSKCAIEINDALSDETREVRRRFLEEHFGLPPVNPAERSYKERVEYLLL